MTKPPTPPLSASEIVREDAITAEVRAAVAATAVVMATLSAHAPHLPEHVIKAAALAAGNACHRRNPQ